MGILSVLELGLQFCEPNVADADEVWNKNFEKIYSAINYIKSRYKINNDSFHLEAQNIFYRNFENKYEEDASYLAYFFICLKNKAISDFKSQCKWESVHVTNPKELCGGLGIFYDENKDNMDIISTSFEDRKIDTVSMIAVKEIDELMYGVLSTDDFDVYQLIKEGYKMTEIATIMESTVLKIQTIRERIRFSVKQITEMSDEEYKRLTTKRSVSTND